MRSFVYNDYITFSQYSDDATGNDLKDQIEFKAYELLFSSLFDKDRTNFDDCPVTEKFKEKFKTNLFDYYNLSKSEDCQKICSLYRQEKETNSRHRYLLSSGPYLSRYRLTSNEGKIRPCGEMRVRVSQYLF